MAKSKRMDQIKAISEQIYNSSMNDFIEEFLRMDHFKSNKLHELRLRQTVTFYLVLNDLSHCIIHMEYFNLRQRAKYRFSF